MEQEFAFGSLTVNFLLGATTIFLLYLYSTRKHGYWKERNVPHPKPIPFLGNALANFIKAPHEIELERYMKYGSVYGYFEGNSPLLSVGDPKLLRDVLIKDFQVFTGHRVFESNDEVTDKILIGLKGEDWKRVRTIITPIFTTGKLKRMLGIFKDCANTLVKNFQAYAEKGEPVDVKTIYGAFAMDSIASSAFSTKIDSHNDPNNNFVAAVSELFKNSLNWRFVTYIFFPRLTKLLRIKVFFPNTVSFFKDKIRQIIEERKKYSQVKNDFLQMLLDTAKESDKESQLEEKEREDIADNYGKVDSDQIMKNVYTKKCLSFNELVAQSVLFFIAGYDNIASTLAFATYFLAINPDVQKKLRTEVDTVLEVNNGEITYEAIQNMKYLDNVISETLRVYPPTIRLDRKADEDYKLGATGIKIPKGMLVSVPVLALHRDPKYYPDPDKFDPERFNPEERARREQCAYLPFGAGPRNCIALRFALLEMKVCLAEVIRHFIIKRCPETKVPLEFVKGQLVMQPKSNKVELEVRRDAITTC